MMKRFFVMALAVATVMFWLTPVLAAPSFLVPDDTGIINVTSPIGDDTYIAGGQVTVDKDINGDLFIGGGEITIDGNVAGDLVVGGGTVQVNGNVGDDVRIGGGRVIINGIVGDDALIGSGTLLINQDAVIKGDFLAGTGDFRLFGRVLGNVKASFETGQITGIIEGDANLKYEDKLTFGENAKIRGKLAYWALAEDLKFESVASVVEYYKYTAGSKGPNLGVAAMFLPAITFGSIALKYLSFLLLGGLLILFLPKYLPRVATTIKKNYLYSLGQGFVFLILVPFIALISLVTLIGASISAILMMSYIMVILFAGVIAAMVIGSYFIKPGKTKASQFGVLAVGSAIYVVLVLVPFVGWIIKLAFILLGVGGLWKDSYSMIKSGKY